MTDSEIILQDMKQTNLAQASWDWEADYRFAKTIKADEAKVEILRLLLKSSAPFAIQIACHRKYGQSIKARRLRALRKLEQQGIVESHWCGTGPGGVNEFSVRRNKLWNLINLAGSCPGRGN